VNVDKKEFTGGVRLDLPETPDVRLMKNRFENSAKGSLFERFNKPWGSTPKAGGFPNFQVEEELMSCVSSLRNPVSSASSENLTARVK